MTQIRDLLEANLRYADARARVGDSRPWRHLAIVTCMDARIDVFAILGLRLGEAHVLRNAGGRVTEDVRRRHGGRDAAHPMRARRRDGR